MIYIARVLHIRMGKPHARSFVGRVPLGSRVPAPLLQPVSSLFHLPDVDCVPGLLHVRPGGSPEPCSGSPSRCSRSASSQVHTHTHTGHTCGPAPGFGGECRWAAGCLPLSFSQSALCCICQMWTGRTTRRAPQTSPPLRLASGVCPCAGGVPTGTTRGVMTVCVWWYERPQDGTGVESQGGGPCQPTRSLGPTATSCECGASR